MHSPGRNHRTLPVMLAGLGAGLALVPAGLAAEPPPSPPFREAQQVTAVDVMVEVAARRGRSKEAGEALPSYLNSEDFEVVYDGQTPDVVGVSALLTGVWGDKHGIRGNDFTGHHLADHPDFLTRLEKVDPAFSTFAIVDWPPLGEEVSGGPMLSPAIDHLVVLDGDEMGYDKTDARTVEFAAGELQGGDWDATFVYLGNIDVVGHELDSLAPEYRAEIERADGWVGRLVQAIRGRRTYEEEDWLILMSTDHGRRDDGGHGGESAEERRIFVLASGGRIKGELESPEIVDVAVTALVHLGVALDPSWKLDGRPLHAASGDPP